MRYLALAWVLLAAATARAQTPPLEETTAAWPAPQRAQARAGLAALTEAGLTEQAGLDLLAEWAAKGATPEQALQLLTTWAGHARAAREAAGRAGLPASAQLVESAAAVLAAGGSAEHLEGLLRQAGSESLARARCFAFTSLLAQGFQPEPAREVLRAATERGYREADLSGLVLSTQRLAREGAAPEALGAAVTSAMRQGVPPARLYPVVSQSMRSKPAVPPRTPIESGFNHEVVRKGR